MPLDNHSYVKIGIRDETGQVETLWAIPVGDNLFRLDNVPFFAYRISDGDIVEAAPDTDGMLMFTRVVRKSGNRTIRALLPLPLEEEPSSSLMETLKRVGCSFERASGRLVCISVPANVLLHSVADALITSGVEWEYADPAHEDLYPSEGTAAP